MIEQASSQWYPATGQVARHKQNYGKFHFKIRAFHSYGGQTLQEASQSNSRLSIIANTQNLAGQPALADPALNRGWTR